MSCKCKMCWAWCPVNWEGYKYVDTEAFCKLRNIRTLADDTCESASMIIPTENKARKTHVQQNTTSTNKEVACTDIQTDTLELYQHQKDAIEYFDKATEIALFFEMGVGKSATILRIVANRFKRGEIDALLVIAPNDVHKQWATEQIPLWLDVKYELQCLFGRGGQRVAYEFDDKPDTLQVVCVNVDTFSTPYKWRDIVAWSNSRRTFIVLDEATTIKNVNALRTQRILYEFNDTVRRGRTIIKSTVKTVARAILTGTPVTNGAMDLWAMMEFLKPNFFGRNWYSFQNYYGMFTKLLVNSRLVNIPLTLDSWTKIKDCSTYEEAYAIHGITVDTYNVIQSQQSYEGPYKNASELREKISDVSIFKLLTECVDMPAQIYNTRYVSMSDAQRNCYNNMVNDYIATYDTHTATALSKLSVMIRLQQISSGFLCDKFIADDNEDTDILPDEIKWIGNSNPKLDALYRDIEEIDKPVIIVTKYTAEAARIYEDLQQKYSSCLVTGWKRIGTIDEFKEGKYQVMVANVVAIARGFNLQRAHAMCFYSNTFSLEHRIQSEGRIFRIGQSNPCEYVDYVNEGTVDERIVSALQLKRKLLDYIRSTDVKEMLT